MPHPALCSHPLFCRTVNQNVNSQCVWGCVSRTDRAEEGSWEQGLWAEGGQDASLWPGLSARAPKEADKLRVCVSAAQAPTLARQEQRSRRPLEELPESAWALFLHRRLRLGDRRGAARAVAMSCTEKAPQRGHPSTGEPHPYPVGPSRGAARREAM